MATKGNLGEVVTTCERSWVQAPPWGFPSGAKKEWGLSPKAKVRVLHTAQLDVTVFPSVSESFREEQAPVEEIEKIQVSTPKKKSNRRRQTAPKKKPRDEKCEDQHCYPWTSEEEAALCKGRETCPITKRRTYDMVKKWKTMCPKLTSFCSVYANNIVTYISGASNTDYLQRALTDYLVEYSIEEELKNKRYKSCGSSSFNTRESGEGSINLNTTVEDEEDELEEVRRPRPIDCDQAKRKAKAASSADSTNAFDVELLAKMMATEYVMVSDPYNVQKSQEMLELLRTKNKELELKAAKLKIRRLENRQSDEALYEMTTNEDLKALLRQRLFG
nr:hypothetical protein [Tanacetum cinerariifolium]